MSEMVEAGRLLREVFGFEEFREGQGRVIETLLAGRSALAVFPTGAGKSLCYQLPALLMDGLTVVVSPLIALMKDQVDALQRRGVAAARLDSSLGTEEARGVYGDLRTGRLKLLYVAPERLAGGRLVQMLEGQRIALLAIDEAHCISEWGHNFRPEYLKLAGLATRLKAGRVLALTATATPDVARDIAGSLGVDPSDVVLTGFHRPNLTIRATPCLASERLDLLRDRVSRRKPGAGVVYVTLQKTAEDVARALAADGHDARPYHAGLSDDRRGEVQEWFMASDAGIVVATIAFGMGIDKADIRYVDHFNLPKTLENYAQEMGRAGRDGLESACELFACADDVVTLENFTYGDTPTAEAVDGLVRSVLKGAGGSEFDVSTYDLSNAHDIRQLVASTILTYLELEGEIEATGPFYREYKLKILKPLETILAGFDLSRAEFLRRVFAEGRQGSKWLTIDSSAAAEALGESRTRVVKALNYLEEQGLVTLEVAGLRQGYRRLRDGDDHSRLVATIVERFEKRETRDVGRVRQVLDMAREENCLTGRLLAYFGDPREGRCGHCGPCLGDHPKVLPTTSSRRLTERDRAIVEAVRAEFHPALRGVRPLSRFLAGLASPATTRAKLTRHAQFGALMDVTFPRIVSFVSNGP